MAARSATVVFLLLICTITIHAHEFLAGSTSLKLVAADIINGFNKAKNQDISPYLAVASGPAVVNFITGEYTNVASDVPMTAAQDLATKKIGSPGKKGKLTIPLCLTTYTFATRKSSKVKLTAAQVVDIYKGTLTSWSKIAAGASGTIVPIARADLSGVTAVINKWISGNVRTWKQTGETTWKGKAGISSKVKFATGTQGVIAALRRDINGIGYMATGLAISSSLYQSKIRNKAGNYLLATEANPYQSIPRVLPPATASWSGVSLVNVAGSKTYGIVSFAYLFARLDASCHHCNVLKSFLLYTQSDAVQNLFGVKYKKQFFRLPPAIIKQNVAAIKKIS